jgi:hypothetical protein
LSWVDLFKLYGKVEPNITRLRLKLGNDLDSDVGDVIGFITQDPTRSNILFFTPDTDVLPTVSVSPITRIIDPRKDIPGITLPVPAIGQRYLLSSSEVDSNDLAIIGNVPGNIWGNISAHNNDIIEYTNSGWVVSFNSIASTSNQYTINTSNNAYYMYNGETWVYVYYGIFPNGFWRIENLIKT